ncbi:MAG: recombination protein RecR [Acholeplasmataceae bacterium]|nr:recombination protein RecR [Acholeplasmataceae bacterium]HPT89455.1 recombination mediator RecR [Bacilli bacterium]HQA19725.1 recombination mediator RecR [Bacilli bacterium]HQD91880.1 recombination mediator RecR [Bacilli bacterium]
MKYPESLSKLIASFQLFPGIGPKTAERLALYCVLNLKDEDVHQFAKNLIDSKTVVGLCKNCGIITDEEVCSICNDNNREAKILVIENTKEAIAIEKMNKYFGKYHVLNGVISPLDGIGPNDINIEQLLNRVKDESIEEVIIATSATMEGETTALYISKLLQNTNVLVTRIGYGLPVGGDIEYADEITLIRSLEGRRKM